MARWRVSAVDPTTGTPPVTRRKETRRYTQRGSRGATNNPNGEAFKLAVVSGFHPRLRLFLLRIRTAQFFEILCLGGLSFLAQEFAFDAWGDFLQGDSPLLGLGNFLQDEHTPCGGD